LCRQRSQMPPSGKSRSTARRDRSLRGPSLAADRADRAACRRHARELRDEAPLRQADRHHACARSGAEGDTWRTVRAPLPDLSSRSGALHTADARRTEVGLRASTGAHGPRGRTATAGVRRRAGGPARPLLIETHSPEETEQLAARLAADLGPGDVVTVSGELGSGKTTFVRGAARALGVEGPVKSPTYTIGHRYKGRVDVSHLDLFRFQEVVSAAEWGDLEPYFDDAIVFVEWPEAGEGVLPPIRIGVRLEHGGEGRRLVTILGDADPGLRHGD